jgi:hypothetical protein
MDGRYGVSRVLPESVALDRANDVAALAAFGQQDCERAHQAYAMDDHRNGLINLDSAHQTFYRIHKLAAAWAADVTSAPEVSPNQLPLLLAA